MAVEEKSIGKLTLDITDVKKKIAEINDFLGRIGANINLEKVLTDKIGTAVNRLISEARKAKDATENAFKDVGIGNVGKQAEEVEKKVKSAITNVSSTLTTFKVSESGQINELVSKVTTGFDQANKKIREFSDSQGEIVKRTVEASSTLANYTEKYVQLYKAQAQLASLNEKGQIGSPAHIKAANEYQQALTAIQKLEEKAASNDERVARSAARIIEKAKATNDVVLAMKQYEATMAGIQRREEEAAAKRSVEEKARAEKAAMEEEAVTLEALVQLYIKQENYERKAASATNKDNVELYKSKAAEVGALIEKVRQLYPELDKWAQADDRIAEAATRRKEAENNAEQKAASSASQKKLEDERQILTDLINLYVRRAQVETELNKASYSENSANVKLYTAKMDDILAQIDAIAKLYPELNQLAAANDRVAEAETRRANAANVLDQKASEANVKEQEQALSRYAQALTAYFNELASLNKAMSGKNGITTDSEEYKRFSDELARLKQNIKEAGETLDKDGRKAAASMDNVQHAIANAAKASAAFRDEQRQSAGTKQIDDAEKAYKRLTTAVNMYNTAKRAKNEQQMGYWQSVVNEQVNALNGVLQEVDALHLDESVRDRILELIRQATTQQGALGTQTQATVSHTSDLSSAVNSIVTRYLSLLAVIRMIKSVLGDMIDYVHQYSDKMNEIRIITGKTSEEAERLGETYRNLAESMSVSSLDMADAAIYFTRQGLGAAEIEKRLKSTTMYAKTANIEFERAAELITAVVNSMNLMDEEAEDGRAAAQRVADVFLKVGDNAATSGEEIGEAMQKAAASAGTFGVQFEWLAAYIAAVSETTRQEARTIGTAFNTIIARLHQIKQQGYNSEDETKINDIAKALANVDIALMDQSGEWRDMTDILQDVAAKWSDMDDKTRSYIATTMAGVKQQNVFLALMNDMSKGVEGGSRAFELYGLAVDSAGTATEKYAIYEESATAAQERLTVAQEKFYSLLQSDTLKWWYDFFTKIVTAITNTTKAMKGINLLIPVLFGMLTTLVVHIRAVHAAANQAAAAGERMTKSFALSHPAMMGILSAASMFAMLTLSIKSASDSAAEMAENYNNATEAVEKSRSALSSDISLQEELGKMTAEVGDRERMTNDQLETYNSLLNELASISPKTAKAVEDLRKGFGDQHDAVQTLNDALRDDIELQKKKILGGLTVKYANRKPGVDTSGSQPENMKYMANWLPEWSIGADENEKMINAIKLAYNAGLESRGASLSSWESIQDFFTQEFGDKADAAHAEYQSYLPEGMFEYIYTHGGAKNLDDDTILKLWRKYFGDFVGGANVIDAMTSEMNAAIEDVIASLASVYGDEDKSLIRELLLESITGADMQLSPEEYRGMYDVISTLLDDISANGLDAIDAKIPLRRIARELFGQDFVDIMSIAIDSVAENPVLVDKIAEAYQTLLSLGFSKDEITDLYSELTNNDDLNANDSIRVWANAEQAMRIKMRENIESAYQNENGESLIKSLFGDDYYSLDTEMLKLLNDLSNIGVAFEDIEKAVTDAKSPEEMMTNLRALFKQIAEEPEVKSLKDLVKELKATEKEIASIDEVLEKLRNGETVKFSDLMDLVDAHPEILAVINDASALEAKLKSLKYAAGENILGEIQNTIMNDEKIMANSPFAKYQTDTVRTLSDLDEKTFKGLGGNKYLAEATASLLSATGQMGAIGDEWMKTLISGMFSSANMDLINRKAIDAAELVKAGWEDAGEGIATVFSMHDTAGTQDKNGNEATLKWNQNVVYSATPILPDGTVLTPEEFDEYINKLFRENTTIEEVLTADKTGNGGKGIIIDISAVADDETFAEAEYRISNLLLILHEIHEFLFGKKGQDKSWLDEQVEAANQAAELEWAKSNNYVEQIGSLSRALESGGAKEAYDVWNRLDEKMKESVASTYPEVAAAMLEIEKATDITQASAEDLAKAENNLANKLQKANKYATAKNFTSTYQAIQKLEKGTISATDAYETFNKELDTVVKAGEDITDVEDKMANQTEVTASDVSNLAKVLGVSADEILQDWPAAVAAFDDMTGAAGELKAVFDMLNEAAFIRITGVSEADFSNIQNGLLVVQDMADETIKLLEATGQWEVDTIQLDGVQAVWENGKIIRKAISGYQKVLKATGKNPYAGRSSGVKDKSKGGKGGGGGGGGDKNSDKSGMTEVERQLDRYSQRNAIQEYQQSYYGAQKSYYGQTGQLQGVIGYSQKEIDLLKEQSEVLEGNVKWIEEYIDKKSAELAQLSITDEKYEEVADDLDKLQKAHQEYTNQLIENKTSIDELTKAIEEQRKKIREMEINLRQTILKAIEDREKRTENMLNAEIEMENTILDLITKRYEKERDQIIENTNLKIDSLNKEKEALDEQLRIRKEQAEAEDKQLKLRELEAKYQRIIADPTRIKEAKSIKSEIDDLRKEMAWDLAEEEVKAQQDSIDQQITSLEDYIEYVQNYYEDLFEHPQKLIAEMRDIMMMTDQEIIEWLKANDEEFDKSTENTQNKMITSWQETLDTMHDVIKTYWDEVEYIIEQGEDYIINFLKENSEDYRQAGKLQAEAYVDEWMEQLENLRKAYQDVATEAASTYSVIEKADSSSSGKSGGGGGGGGSGSGKNKHGYSFNYGGTDYAKDGYSSEILARTAGLALVESLAKKERDANGKANPSGGTVYEYQNNEINKRYLAAKNGLIAFGRGGIADFTGPAWVDGSVQDPERILTPYQNKLFETMVSVLEQVGRISISSMPYYGDMRTTGGNPVTVGDIIVNVENLDTDDDYEELAEKVSEVLMDRIGRTAAIGGLRIRSI